MDKILFGNRIKLRAKQLSDARLDYEWQQDPELARLDASTAVTSSFPDYLTDFTAHLRSPNPLSRLFAIVTLADRYIGNCSYYNINEERRETELGIMIGDRDFWGKGYGQDAVRTLVRYIFLDTGLTRIHLKSLDWNYRAHRCFEKCGFTRAGYLYREGYSFMSMEVRREQWLERHVKTSPAFSESGFVGDQPEH